MALDFRNSCLKNFNELLIYNLRQRNCNINMVKKLLAHKVDVNYKDCFLNTSLHYVVQNCSDKLDLIREILNMEGNPNAVNAEGNSPLHLAVLKSNGHVILELIKFGGDVRLTNKSGNTPLHVAAMRGKPCIIEILLKSDTSLIDCGNIRGNTPLHIAVIHGKPYAAEMLIRHEAYINCRNKEGNTPLHMGIIHDKEDIVKTLTSLGALLNRANKEGNTPLHLAVAHGKLNIVQNLLNCGADVGFVNAKGDTPLHLAALHNRFDIAEVLIEYKADINCHNQNLSTPLHLAAINGNCKLIRKLVNSGGLVHCCDIDGNTAMHLAVIHDRQNAVECLIVHGAEHNFNRKGYTPLHLAVKDGKYDMVIMLLCYGADINCRDADLNAPLHLAAIHDQPDILIKLIEAKAKTDVVNRDNHSALQVAALHGNVNMVHVLFQNGIRVKLRNQGRRYISSFAESLIQHSNAATQAATGGNTQPPTSGVAGASQNNSSANSGSLLPLPNPFMQFLSVSSPIHSVAPAGHPVTTFNFSATNAGPSTGSHPAPEANSLIHEMQQLLSSPPGLQTSQQPVSTTGAPPHLANAVSTSSVSSQTHESIAPTIQGSNPTGNGVSVPQVVSQENILPGVAQTMSALANAMNFPTHQNPPNPFAEVLYETDQAYVLGPISIAQPPTLAEVQAWTDAQPDFDGTPPSDGVRVGQAMPDTYVAFLDELDAEGDPMSWSWSPFLRNSRSEETTVVDNLVKFYGINGRNRSGNQHLHYALMSDDPSEIACVLQFMPGINKSLRRENSFLHLAAVHGKPKLVKALIESGATVDSKNNEMNTPLHFAAFCGEAKIIDILCQSGANIDLMNRRGATPLKYAFSYCRVGVVRTLGKFGSRRFIKAAQTLAKYDVLKKGLYLTRHKVLKANCVVDLLRYVEACCREVLLMKQKQLGKNFSFYQFVIQALSNPGPLRLIPHVEAAVSYLIEISSDGKYYHEYYLYRNILIFLITTKLEKKYWKRKLLDEVDRAVEKGKISLNRRLFSSICDYLSNPDIFNLLLAFTDAKFEH